MDYSRFVSWGSVGASVKGTSHDAESRSCEDSLVWDSFALAEFGERLIVVISDGAGSATNAEVGSKLVSRSLHEIVKNATSSIRDLDTLSEETVRSWFLEARDLVRKAARDSDGLIRDFAATALLAIASETSAVIAQVGDGAIVLRADASAEFQIAVWPDTGEYANETYFITDEFVAEHIRIAWFDRIDDLVAFSDGLQWLALDRKTQKPHSGFFQPLVDAVRKSDIEPGSLAPSLVSFLMSEQVNSKTNDDKTLFIACRLPATS